MNEFNPWESEEYPQTQPLTKLANITVSTLGRVGANFLDEIFYILLILAVIIVPVIFDISPEKSGASLVVQILSYTFLALYYLVIPIYTKGQTLGKKILHHRIIHRNGRYASLIQILFRNMIYIIIIGVGIFNTALSEVFSTVFWIASLVLVVNGVFKQALHDKYSHTIVVYDVLYSKYREDYKIK